MAKNKTAKNMTKNEMATRTRWRDEEPSRLPALLNIRLDSVDQPMLRDNRHPLSELHVHLDISSAILTGRSSGLQQLIWHHPSLAARAETSLDALTFPQRPTRNCRAVVMLESVSPLVSTVGGRYYGCQGCLFILKGKKPGRA